MLRASSPNDSHIIRLRITSAKNIFAELSNSVLVLLLRDSFCVDPSANVYLVTLSEFVRRDTTYFRGSPR